jgi:hypothetical protein
MCAANLTRLGCLYKREGRLRAAQEVLELAAKLGSLEAVVEMTDFHTGNRKRNRHRFAG